MSEALKFEGKLARLRIDAQHLALKIQGHITAIRELLDPTIDDLDALRCDEAAVMALELADAKTQWIECQAKIKSIERELR